MILDQLSYEASLEAGEERCPHQTSVDLFSVFSGWVCGRVGGTVQCKYCNLIFLNFDLHVQINFQAVNFCNWQCHLRNIDNGF